MAGPIPPTTDIETEEVLKVFLEYMNRPSTKEELKQFKRAGEVYKNTKMRN